MMYKDGFYKFDTTLLYGANWILNKEYTLLREHKDQYEFPLDGWYWFDSLDEACAFFDLNMADYTQQENDDAH